MAALTVQSPLARAPAAMPDGLLRKVRDAAGQIKRGTAGRTPATGGMRMGEAARAGQR